ncbi:hypothetical protein HPB48_014503 [Haemaphysalis longicornis]|uniref:YqaJ viral recombinase domain-containing protein n=1 Tax=Haemaphysalis longicornis TaxID=44386 RepID=A0A9J6GXD0_HAELO|nr:hypothetical protein HPB48_014503 [Haemaphysalis longicornis]
MQLRLQHIQGMLQLKHTDSADKYIKLWRNCQTFCTNCTTGHDNTSARVTKKKIELLLTMPMSHRDATRIEEDTRMQGKCLSWYQQRCGRITGSIVSRVVKCKSLGSAARLASNIAQAPLVLYENQHRKTCAMRHGTEHEEAVRRHYVDHQSLRHMNFLSRDAGLFICEKFQCVAASPDGIIKCSCCGRGVFAIKCPYKYKDTHADDNNDKGFYHENGRLKENHEYMFQVQTEMVSADVSYCDFVCWTSKSFVVVRVLRDTDFIEKHMPVLRGFLKHALLPQLLSRKSINEVQCNDA